MRKMIHSKLSKVVKGRVSRTSISFRILPALAIVLYISSAVQLKSYFANSMASSTESIW